MLLQKIALVAGVGLLLSGCSLLGSPQSEVQVESETNMRQTEPAMEGATTTYSLEQVAEHNTKSDCWVIVQGGVYDVSTFVASDTHPGGDISAGCGTDITAMFFNRPEGKGPHPQTAQEFLGSMRIGVVQTEQ